MIATGRPYVGCTLKSHRICRPLMFASLLVASCGHNHPYARELVEITLTPDEPSIAAGTSVRFAATARFSDDTTEDVATEVAWTSSATSVVAIHDGVATGLAIGTSAISATFSG